MLQSEVAARRPWIVLQNSPVGESFANGAMEISAEGVVDDVGQEGRIGEAHERPVASHGGRVAVNNRAHGRQVAR